LIEYAKEEEKEVFDFDLVNVVKSITGRKNIDEDNIEE